MVTKPNLYLLPTAYGAGKVYSVLPAGGIGDFTFSRPTNATRINKDGLIEVVGGNMPRLNYPMIDGVVSGCPSLLLEPARTNLVTHSEDFSDASWFKRQITISTNEIISPDGTLNAYKIYDTSDNNIHGFNETVTTTANTPYNVSVFVKKGTLRYVALQQYYNISNGSIAFFDLENGTLVYSQTLMSSTITFSIYNEKIESYGNGWYRISATFTSSESMDLGIVFANSQWSSGTAYNNYYVGSGDYLYAWGFQLEQGSYPTSYIPTNGSATTRNAETCNGAGDANTFNDSEGVLFAEVSALDESLLAISLSDGTTSNDVILFYYLNRIYLEINNSLTSISIFKSDIGSSNSNKIALKYKSGDVAMFLNGFEILTSTNAISLSGLDRINFDYGNGSYDFYGNTKQIQYFDSVLNDTELEYMTSYRSFNEMARELLYTIE